jgi:hypothetical protein
MTMTSDAPQHTPARADPDDAPQFEARFQAFLQELRDGVDHPDHGEDYRQMLADDPDDLRNVFAFSEALAAARPEPEPMPWYVTAVFVVAFAAITACSVYAALTRSYLAAGAAVLLMTGLATWVMSGHRA